MKIEKQRNWGRIRRNFIIYIASMGVGSVLVWFFWLRNRDVPSLWPEGMVKDKISRSTLLPNDTNQCYLTCLHTNDSILKQLVQQGNVRFNYSKGRRTPPVYAIDTKSDKGVMMRLWIESADSTFNIFKIDDLPGTTENHSCQCPVVTF